MTVPEVSSTGDAVHDKPMSETSARQGSTGSADLGSSLGDKIKGFAGMIHGSGEAIRGNINSLIDGAGDAITGRSNNDVATRSGDAPRATAQKGLDEFRAGLAGVRGPSRSTAQKPGGDAASDTTHAVHAPAPGPASGSGAPSD